MIKCCDNATLQIQNSGPMLSFFLLHTQNSPLSNAQPSVPHLHQKDERARPGNFQISKCLPTSPTYKHSVSHYTPLLAISLSLSLSLSSFRISGCQVELRHFSLPVLLFSRRKHAYGINILPTADCQLLTSSPSFIKSLVHVMLLGHPSPIVSIF